MPDVPGETDDFETITALLADARATGPIPDDVAARLDAVLAGLGRPETPSVLPWQRRLGPRLLAAASVVLLLAGITIGVNQLDNRDQPSSASDAARPPASSAGADSKASPDRTPALLRNLVESLKASSTDLQLHQRTFAADATRVVAAYRSGELAPGSQSHATNGGARADTASPSPTGSAALDGVSLAVAGCPGPQPRGTTTVPVLLDRSPAALVIFPGSGPRQRVEAWSCDGSSLLREATVPVH